jgi:vitamin B12 transporter
MQSFPPFRATAALTLFLSVLIPPIISAETATAPPPFSGTLVVTTSAEEETLASAPASATVITREEIDARQATDVATLLRGVAGASLSTSGSPGKATSLFLRGGASTHTLVLVDGSEVNNPYFAGFDWGRFSTSGVERVEIVRGPYSALYGSDAISGVVHVITSREAPALAIDLAGGERGLVNLRAESSWNGGPLAVQGAVERRSDDGWAPNDDLSQTTANSSIRWSSEGRELALRVRWSEYELGIPYGPDATGTALVSTTARRQDGNELQVTLPFEQRSGRLGFGISLSHNRRSDSFADPEDPFGFTESITESSTSRARAIIHFDSAAGRTSAGGEYETISVDDSSNFGITLDGRERLTRAFFAEQRAFREFSRGRMELAAGVRHDSVDSFGSTISPRMGIAWLSGSNKYRASYGEGFRAPSIGELYFPFAGNSGLEAETSRSAEIGFDRTFGARHLASITLFEASSRNLIHFDNSTFRFANIGAAESRGAELSGRAQLTGRLAIGVSWTHLETEDRATGEPLPRRPKNSGALHLDYAVNRLSAAMTILHTGDRRDVEPLFPWGHMQSEAWTTADLALRYRLGSYVPYLTVQNLAGTEYEEIAGYRAAGRRLLIGIRYSVQ